MILLVGGQWQLRLPDALRRGVNLDFANLRFVHNSS
jgi:hypothetical protein